MMKRRHTPDDDTALDALDRRLAELEERRKAATAEILALEAAGFAPAEKDARPGETAAVLAMLAGDGDAEEPDPSPAVRLHRLLVERELIDRALVLGQQRGFKLRVERAAELVGDIEGAWRKNIVRTAALLERLEELATERDRLGGEYRSRLGIPSFLPCEGQHCRVAPRRVVGDAVYVFLQDARREGLL